MNRRGSVLAVVFSLIVVIGVLLLVSSDQVLGATRLQELNAARQQALYASEAVAAIKETHLANLVAGNDLAALASKPDPNYGAQWFGNCLVRWRIEPVRTQGASDYTVNPDPQPPASPPAMPAGYIANGDLLSFRIATEAYALTDADNGAGHATAPTAAEAAESTSAGAPARAPWRAGDGASERRCVVQTSRLVQFKLRPLFGYALFYAASGPDGDIEVLPPASAPALTIAGAVHSNGAIYLGGGGGVSGDTPLDGAGARIGGTGSGLVAPNAAVSVVGIDGIFRMHKGNNHAKGIGDPLSVPPGDLPGAVPMPDVNARQPSGADNRFRLNDVDLTRFNDSRSHRDHAAVGFLATNRMADDFGAAVRDGNRDATLVATLATIPDSDGRPFEMQRAAPAGSFLAVRTAGADPLDQTQWTIDPLTPPAQWVYWLRADRAAVAGAHVATATALSAAHGGTAIEDLYYDAGGAITTRAVLEGGGSTIAALSINPAIRPIDRVPAAGMPLYFQDAGLTTVDVAVPALAPTGSGFNGAFHPRLVNGLYVEKARRDAGNQRFGLCIRGRAAVDAGVFTSPGDDALLAQLAVRPGPPRADDAYYLSGARTFVPDMIKYLRSRYAVHLGEQEITKRFFEHQIAVPSEVGTGLTGTYYNNKHRLPPVVLTQPDEVIDFPSGPVHPGVDVDDYGAIWRGQVKPEFSEVYTFQTTSDDGCRLTVNGQRLIDDLNDHGATTRTGTIALTAGQKVDLMLEWYDQGGPARIELRWSSASRPLEIIPANRLFSTTGVSGQLLAIESPVLDRRLARFMQARGYPDALAVTPHPAPANQQAHMLTLRVDAVQDFLRTTPSSAVGLSGTGPASDHFSGLLYVARHRRDLNGTVAGDGFAHPVRNPGSVLVDPSPINASVNTPQDAVFHDAIRLANAETIDWGGTIVHDRGANPADPADDTLRRAGLTVVTPHRCYVQGDFNIVPDAISTVTLPRVVPTTGVAARTLLESFPDPPAAPDPDVATLRFPPCAIAADSLTLLSRNWSDAAQVGLIAGAPPAAIEGWLHASVITNNLPTDSSTLPEGSGGVSNALRLLEDWTGQTLHVRGSLVVLNRMRYDRSRLGAAAFGTVPEMFRPPTLDLRYDPDLLTASGQPPFTPYGAQVIRRLSTVVPFR